MNIKQIHASFLISHALLTVAFVVVLITLAVRGSTLVEGLFVSVAMSFAMGLNLIGWNYLYNREIAQIKKALEALRQL